MTPQRFFYLVDVDKGINTLVQLFTSIWHYLLQSWCFHWNGLLFCWRYPILGPDDHVTGLKHNGRRRRMVMPDYGKTLKRDSNFLYGSFNLL